MVSLKPVLSLSLTYSLRMAWSAAGEPVNRPVLIAPGVSAIVFARAAPAAIHASWEVRLTTQAHAASGFFAAVRDDEGGAAGDGEGLARRRP